ncbi:hypothetical protein DYQ86_21520 [Acidobacteria bacterium AB60]|nr:hypothetical protein DYQ86_21520 [Acidobacteria bacterium AB60]
MRNQTVTRATEADVEPAAIYRVLADANSLPQWAPAFADAIEPLNDTQLRVTKGGEAFRVEFVRNETAGTVDIIREMPNGRRGGAYMRVTPRPLGGSSLAITVPLSPTTNEAEVGRTLEEELATLIRLANISG